MLYLALQPTASCLQEVLGSSPTTFAIQAHAEHATCEINTRIGGSFTAVSHTPGQRSCTASKQTGGHMMPLRCGAVHTQLPCICMCLAMCHVQCVLAGEEGNHRRTQGHILSTPQHHEVQPATYTAASTDQTPGCSAAASCTPVKHHAACRATDAQQSVLHNCDSTPENCLQRMINALRTAQQGGARTSPWISKGTPLPWLLHPSNCKQHTTRGKKQSLINSKATCNLQERQLPDAFP